jgi:hypothetical protein
MGKIANRMEYGFGDIILHLRSVADSVDRLDLFHHSFAPAAPIAFSSVVSKPF